MKFLLFVLMALITGCTGCSTFQQVLPKQIVTVVDMVFVDVPMEFDSTDVMPLELADPNYWQVFWMVNWINYHGVTICYGTYGVVTQLSPLVPKEKKIGVMRHERVHQEQVYRYTCDGLNERTSTPEGRAIIEAEAFVRSEVLTNDELIEKLMQYEGIKTLSRDSLKQVIKDYLK
jgi:hypothetical protein